MSVVFGEIAADSSRDRRYRKSYVKEVNVKKMKTNML